MNDDEAREAVKRDLLVLYQERMRLKLAERSLLVVLANQAYSEAIHENIWLHERMRELGIDTNALAYQLEAANRVELLPSIAPNTDEYTQVA